MQVSPPQSPVEQVPVPLGLKLQAVRAQNRPDQPAGGLRVSDEPCGRVWFDCVRRGGPFPVSEAGQTVYGQLLRRLNTVADAVFVEKPV